MSFAVPESHGAFPARITLELTNRCNLNCTFCPRCYMEKARGDMDLNLAKRLIDEMVSHRPVAMVPFFRGETLLHPHWFDVLEYFQQKEVGDIQFTTNASLLTPDNVERLLDLDLSFISFSLDTVDPVLYNANRRGAKFDTTTDNVLRFLKRRKERGLGTQVQVSSVETEAHKPGMKAFVDYWLPKVDRIRVYTEHSSDGEPGSIGEPLPDFDERLPCHKPFNDMVVYWNGQVASCNHDWTRMVKGSPLGDVSKDGIEGVWNGAHYRSFREAHMGGAMDGVTPCDNCDHWKMYYITEGFLGRTYVNGG